MGVHQGAAEVYLSFLINNALKLYSVATRLQCNADSEEGQVHLGCALVYLPFSSSPLHRSCTRRKASTSRLRLDVLAILLVQLQLKSTAAKSRYTLATPRCTWTHSWKNAGSRDPGSHDFFGQN